MTYIKTVALLKRRAGMPFEEFQAYYENHHSEIARQIPELSYYVRRYLRPAHKGGYGDDPDVLTELWYASAEDFRQARARLAEPSFNEMIRADEDRLFERSAMRYYTVDERHSEFLPLRPALLVPGPTQGSSI